MKRLFITITSLIILSSLAYADTWKFNDNNVPIATTSRRGTSYPDGSTITIDTAGKMSLISGSVVAPIAYLYVGKNGNDTSGTGAANAPYLTIGKAISVATSGTTVFIWPGTYTENIAFKAGVNLTTTAKFAVTITGNHTAAFVGTVIVENIILNSATGVTLAATNSANQMNLQFIGSDINSGTGDAVNWINTNAASKLSITDGNVNVSTSGVSARAIYTDSTSAGSFILNRSSVKLDTAANVAVALNGAVSYTHTSDVIYGQVTVANTASCTLSILSLTASGAANLTTNSSGATVLAEVISITDTTPAYTGAGVFTFLAISELGAGVGGNSTLNGGLGPIPLALAPNKIREFTLYPAGSVAAGQLKGTFEVNSADHALYFTQNTTRGIIPIATGISANHAICWKSATTLGYCSDVVSATGTCTCN